MGNMAIKKQPVTEVTGPEPCASANSAISALATRLRTSESLILFFHVGVKAFFASFCASFASTYCFSTTRVIESNQWTLILLYEVVEYRRSCYNRREGKEYETGIINRRQLQDNNSKYTQQHIFSF